MRNRARQQQASPRITAAGTGTAARLRAAAGPLALRGAGRRLALMLAAAAAALVLAGGLTGGLAVQAQGRGGGGGGSGGGGFGAGPADPVDVGVLTLAHEQVPFSMVLPGRAAAFELADIRPRVGGVVESVDYQPGHDLLPGDEMFHLEADSYRAALAAATAQRDSARAAVAVAEARAERDRKLAGVGSSQATLESSEAALAQARAALQSAEAALETAQLDLDRVVIRSPIEGVAGLPLVSTGALVTANQTAALAQVVRLDPIYVDVSQSSARMLRVRERIETGDLHPGASLQVALTLENGEQHEGEGRFVSPGTQVSATTGSIDMRFEFDNPERKILPGQFLRVTLTLGTSEAILVAQRATRRQPDGSLTAFVVREGKARQVTLTYSGTHANAWVVTEGVEPGDLLIVDGLNNLRDGAEVTPVPVRIDTSGVVHDLAPADAPPGEVEPPSDGTGPQGEPAATEPDDGEPEPAEEVRAVAPEQAKAARIAGAVAAEAPEGADAAASGTPHVAAPPEDGTDVAPPAQEAPAGTGDAADGEAVSESTDGRDGAALRRQGAMVAPFALFAPARAEPAPLAASEAGADAHSAGAPASAPAPRAD